MRATLDGQELQTDGGSLAAAIRAGAEAARARSRIVIEVQVDGARIGEAALEEPGEGPLDGEHVEMTSADPVALVRVTLFDAADALQDADAHHAASAEQIHRGDLSAAMGSITELLATWQAVRDAVTHGSAAVGGTLDRYATDADLGGRIDALAGLLAELRAALGANDLTRAADVVEYDLREEGERWRGMLRTIAGAMKPSD
ncbi:MAG: hypothetical protein AAFX79_11290 [Planctomycetota bacterium]